MKGSLYKWSDREYLPVLIGNNKDVFFPDSILRNLDNFLIENLLTIGYFLYTDIFK